MKSKRLEFIIVVFLFITQTGLQAQESLSVSGGDASSSDGVVSYSVGQMFYLQTAGTSGSISHGVQQPYEILTVTEISEAEDIGLAVSVYPNPFTDYLTIKVSNPEISSLCYQLCDIDGKLLESKNLTSPETNIAMSRYSSGTYLLKIIQKNKDILTFKIIKNL